MAAGTADIVKKEEKISLSYDDADYDPIATDEDKEHARTWSGNIQVIPTAVPPPADLTDVKTSNLEALPVWWTKDGNGNFIPQKF